MFAVGYGGSEVEQLYSLWDGAVARSGGRFAEALAGGGLDQLAYASTADGQHAVDGRVGEDPPAGWRPVSGQPAVTPRSGAGD